MTTPAAIIIAGALIAAALAFGHRYEFRVVGDEVVRVDRLMGRVKQCPGRAAGMLSPERVYSC